MKKSAIYALVFICAGKILAAEYPSNDYHTVEKLVERHLALLSHQGFVANIVLEQGDLANLRITDCGHTIMVLPNEKKWVCRTCKKKLKAKNLMKIPEEIRLVLASYRLFAQQHKELKECQEEVTESVESRS